MYYYYLAISENRLKFFFSILECDRVETCISCPLIKLKSIHILLNTYIIRLSVIYLLFSRKYTYLIKYHCVRNNVHKTYKCHHQT